MKRRVLVLVGLLALGLAQCRPIPTPTPTLVLPTPTPTPYAKPETMGEALDQWRQRMEEMLEEELHEGRRWLTEYYGEWVIDFDVSIVIEEVEGGNEMMVVYSDLPEDSDPVLWWTREHMVNYTIFDFCEKNDFQPEGVHLIIFESRSHPSAEEWFRKFFHEAEEGEWPFEDHFMICDISWEELVSQHGGEPEDKMSVFRDAEHCTRW